MIIKEITKAYVRHYTDNGQTTAYVEWVDHNGQSGRTEGAVRSQTGTIEQCYGPHMGALIARAICNGIEIEDQTW